MAEQNLKIEIGAKDSASAVIAGIGETLEGAFSSAAQTAAASVGALDGAISQLETRLEESAPLIEETLAVWERAGESFRASLEGAVASFIEGALLQTEGAKSAVEGLWRSLVGVISQALAQLGVRFIMNALLHGRAKQKEAMQALAADFAKVYAGQFAAMSSAPFPINLTAPAVASAMLAAAQAGSAAAGATGAALGAGVVAFQEGGFVPLLPGASPNRDSVHALLEPGELIVPKPLAKEFYELFSRGGTRLQAGGVAGGGAGGEMSVNINIENPLSRSFIEDLLKEINALVERYGFKLTASNVL